MIDGGGETGSILSKLGKYNAVVVAVVATWYHCSECCNPKAQTVISRGVAHSDCDKDRFLAPFHAVYVNNNPEAALFLCITISTPICFCGL